MRRSSSSPWTVSMSPWFPPPVWPPTRLRRTPTGVRGMRRMMLLWSSSPPSGSTNRLASLDKLSPSAARRIPPPLARRRQVPPVDPVSRPGAPLAHLPPRQPAGDHLASPHEQRNADPRPLPHMRRCDPPTERDRTVHCGRQGVALQQGLLRAALSHPRPARRARLDQRPNLPVVRLFSHRWSW